MQTMDITVKSVDKSGDKGKRKRLTKACDACHKSKRRCDGTSPCSNCYYAAKTCTYTDAAGRPVPAPHQDSPEENDNRKRAKLTDPAGGLFGFSSVDPNPTQVEINLEPIITRELTNLFFTHCHPVTAIIHRPTFTSSLSHGMVPPHLLYAVCTVAAAHSINPEVATVPPRLAGRRFAEETRRLMFDDSEQGQGSLIQPPTLATAQALAILLFYETIVQDGVESNPTVTEKYRDLTLGLIQTLNVHTPEHPLLTPVPSQSYILGSIDRECLRRVFWFVYIVDSITGTYHPPADNESVGSSGNSSSPSPPPHLSSPQHTSSSYPAYPQSPSANPYPPYSHPSSFVAPSQYPSTSQSPTPPSGNGVGAARISGGINSGAGGGGGVGASGPGNKVRASSGMSAPVGAARGRGLANFSEGELRLRLPADETSFELGMVYESLPEYLYLPGMKTKHASELGHLIRVMSIFQKIEVGLDPLFEPAPREAQLDVDGLTNSQQAAKGSLAYCEKLLDEWHQSLHTTLLFNADTFRQHTAMLETPSNASAWCWAQMHAVHVAATLALSMAKLWIARLTHPETAPPPQDRERVRAALEKHETLVNLLGHRMYKAVLLGFMTWTLLKYLVIPTEDQLEGRTATWVRMYDGLYGIDLRDAVARSRARWVNGGRSIGIAVGRRAGSVPGANKEENGWHQIWQPGPLVPSSAASATGMLRAHKREQPGPDIDPALVEGKNANAGGKRTPPAPAGGANVLPSLKSSGLLDFNRQSPKCGLPVGMPWLADEQGSSQA